jgi:hypothetical protein
MPWIEKLKYNPIEPLLNSDEPAIQYFTKKVLLKESVGPISEIWNLSEVNKILRKQIEDGSFKHYKKTEIFPKYHHSLVETWKNFRNLINHYHLTKEHPKIEKAAEFIFSCQTDEGDIRGMIGNQYATYYTGAMVGILIRAGYSDDSRIEKGFEWLLRMRHEDGGWTVPIQTYDLNREKVNKITSEYAEPLEPKKKKPSSRLATDMVLRAFAADPYHRYPEVATQAGKLLKSWFFKPDCYSSYKAASYWVRFIFWWPNLKTSLNSLSLLGFPANDPDIKKGLDWFIDHQQPNGLWNLTYVKDERGVKENQKNQKRRLWLTLDICNIFKRFFQNSKKI